MATASKSKEDDRDFECTICHELVEPPITTCSEGHLVCSQCRATIDLCATCQSNKWYRNRLAERCYERIHGHVNSSALKCKHSANGCEEVFANNADKEAHEVDKCRYLCQRCPGKFLSERPPERSTVEVMNLQGRQAYWHMGWKALSHHGETRDFNSWQDESMEMYMQWLRDRNP